MPCQIIKWPAASNTAVAALQDVAATGSFVLNSLVSGRYELSNVARPITITSGFDNSGATISLIGLDENNQSIVEDLTGPNAGTVTSTLNYNVLFDASSDDDITGASIGYGLTGVTKWIYGNDLKKYFGQYYVGVEVVDVINYTVKFAISPFTTNTITGSSPIPLDPLQFPVAADMVGATTSQVSYIEGPIFGFQLTVNSSDTDGEFRFCVSSQGT